MRTDTPHTPPSSQRGAVLLVGLIMLLMMTVVGLAAMRGSSMQELMAGSMRDRNLAFQAAEAALRAGEAELNGMSALPFDGSRTGFIRAEELLNNGLGHNDFWDQYAWDGSSAQTSMDLEWINSQPRYVVEEVTALMLAGADGGAIDFESSLKTEETIFYRVTGRGVGGTETSVVILQSTFKR